MKIVDVICSPGRTGFYFDDQRAIKAGAGHDGVFYTGEPVTEGFQSVRQAGESISVMIVLEDGQVAYGDCAAVQYIKPELVGKEANDFRGLCKMMEAIQVEGKRLHTAIRYGVSQAILDAVARATGRLMCEVVADEYGCTVSDAPIPVFTQSGDDRYDNSDKMIIKGAQVLPHALINNIDTKLGAKPFHLRIEGPMDCDCDRETQVVALAGLTKELDERGINVELVADEWCNTLEDIKIFADNKAGHMVQIKTPDLGGINNTIEAVLYCKEKGIGAYQGGTCNETDRSAQVCVHCAMATQPVQILAKPGMGVDEGYMIVYNEMNRILAFRKAKKASK